MKLGILVQVIPSDGSTERAQLSAAVAMGSVLARLIRRRVVAPAVAFAAVYYLLKLYAKRRRPVVVSLQTAAMVCVACRAQACAVPPLRPTAAPMELLPCEIATTPCPPPHAVRAGTHGCF